MQLHCTLNKFPSKGMCVLVECKTGGRAPDYAQKTLIPLPD